MVFVISKEKNDYVAKIPIRQSVVVGSEGVMTTQSEMIELFRSDAVYFLVDISTMRIIDVNDKEGAYDTFECTKEDYVEMGLDPARLKIFFTRTADAAAVNKAVDSSSIVSLKKAGLKINKDNEVEL